MAAIGSAIAFEWIKARTVRSTTWSLILCFATSVGIALLFGSVLRGAYDNMSPEGKAGFDPVGSGFNGLRLGMIALVMFGVMLAASEYTTGTVRSSLAAVPRRGLLYGAKIIITVLIAFPFSAIVVLATFFTAQTAIGSAHNAAITDDGVIRSVVGAVFYMTLLCTFAVGLATMLRSPALTLGILVPLFFMVSEILNNLPGVKTVAQFLPDFAGGLVLRRQPPDDTILDAWSGMGVLLLWTVATVLGGYLTMRRRDA
ncbi:ABC transporter permease [Plantactinospora veratri]|uniref:ABC transporter permease n=1 Tax=Plantactinospora veratri TaxID=1436122 RepID=A0ABU7SEC0_9ACTN